MRLGLLFAISWVMGLTTPLLEALGKALSGRDLILLGGGLFLVGKATHEIHDKLEAGQAEPTLAGRPGSFGFILAQIVVLDIVFSLDSVITAVGMANELWVMVTAMVVSVAFMLAFADSIGEFVHRHPGMRVLALAFLLLIGVMLTAEGMGQHISKAYVYFAMAFSFGLELINMRVRKSAPVELHRRFEDEPVSTIERNVISRRLGRGGWETAARGVARFPQHIAAASPSCRTSRASFQAAKRGTEIRAPVS